MTGEMISTHRTWEDWATMVLGVLIGISPWMTGATDQTMVVATSVVVGALLVLVGILEQVRLHRLEEVFQLFCGLFVLAAPSWLVYGGTLAAFHYVLGALVAVLAILELWQDWSLSDRELARSHR